MNNIIDILKSFKLYVSNDHRIRAYEINKPWEEARIFEYVIIDKKIITYTGRESNETLWDDVNTLISSDIDLFWTEISENEAFMYPFFKELFLGALIRQFNTI